MRRIHDISLKSILLGVVALGTIVSTASARENKFEALYNFCGEPNCSDGGYSFGGLLEDTEHDLYGTTIGGGMNQDGTVFLLSPDNAEAVLHTFTDGSDGGGPFGALIADKSGNLYGTTFSGGEYDAGTVFRLAPDGTFTPLHSFYGPTDGCYSYASLIEDKKNNLYGTTSQCGANNAGTIFKLKQ